MPPAPPVHLIFWRDAVRKRHKAFDPLTRAIADDIRRAVRGDHGARMVVNIAAVHVSAFCAASNTGDPKPYKNVYDLQATGSLVGHPKTASLTRRLIDSALPLPQGVTPQDVYFGAVELTGSGIRYYGDLCLVLKPDAVPNGTVILQSNSYDLSRSPWVEAIDTAPLPRVQREEFAAEMAGIWPNDLPDIAVHKVFQSNPNRARLLTHGEIAEGIRTDESYIEVIKHGSFGTGALEEVRLDPADVSLDNQITERLRSGPAPSAAELLWRRNRRDAVSALMDANVPVRVVTTPGRVRR